MSPKHPFGVRLAEIRARLTDAVFAEDFAAGQRMTLAPAIAEAAER